METAKVDIRKLQLLNDRISQTIEALNQVRLSVHGLSASPIGQLGISQAGYPIQAALGAGYGVSPFGVPVAYSQLQGIPGLAQGLSHTGGYGASPFGVPGAYSQLQGIPGMAQNLAQAAGYQSGGYGASPFGVPGAYSQLQGIPGLAQNLAQAGGYGASQFGIPGAYSQLQGIPGLAQGLSHTGGYGLLPQLQAQLQSASGLQNPWLAQSLISSGLAAGQIPQTGLAHSSPEFLDASAGSRQALGIAFPFAQWNYSPFQSNQ